ncbi:MAG: HAD-IA family hydrolase [Clostridia bacterium]|nr:HAD-IA family hydrolase [Clostridia bacterium]
MIKNIFFDMDETIYAEKNAKIKAESQVTEFIAKSLNISYEEVNDKYIKVKKEIFSKTQTDPNRNSRTNWYESLLENLNCKIIEPKLLSKKYWDVVKSNIELFEDFKLILPELKRKYNLYIITDELREIQNEKLLVLGVKNDFKKSISSTDVGKIKPNKEIFEYALRETNSVKEDSLMIGDNPSRDIEGAKRAGIKTVWLKRGKYYFYPLEEKNTADIIITNYLELINKILKLQ